MPQVSHERAGRQLSLGVARAIGYFALLDILIFPYFAKLVMPYSLPVVTAALLIGKPIKRDKYFVLFVVLAVCVFSSAALSVLFRADVTYVENAKRAFQLLTSFTYFFYFRWLGEQGALKLRPILWIFVAYFIGWIVLWTTNPQGTANMLASVYPAGSFMTEEVVLFFRFPYAFSDPNAAAYFFLIGSGFLVAYSPKISTPALVAVVVADLAAVVSTQSRGAMVALGIVAAIAMWDRRAVIRRHPIILAIIAGAILAGIVAAWSWLAAHTGDGTQVGTLLKLVGSRVSGESVEWQAGRSSRYKWALTENVFFLIGRGYVVIRDGSTFPPHSDHMRFLIGYGIVGWGSVVLLLFRHLRRAYAFAIPALLAFSINTLVDEQKMLSLYLIALAVWSTMPRDEPVSSPHPSPSPPRTPDAAVTVAG